MSGTLRERSSKGGEGKISGDGGNDQNSGIGLPNNDDSDDNIKKGHGRKVKRVSFSFRKVNNRIRQLGSFRNSMCWGGGGGGGGGGRGGGEKCCLCLKGQMTLGSAGESPTSDPNSSEFGYDMLRGLIEKNNFYDKDCNTHLVGDLDVYTQVSSSCCSHIKEK